MYICIYIYVSVNPTDSRVDPKRRKDLSKDKTSLKSTRIFLHGDLQSTTAATNMCSTSTNPLYDSSSEFYLYVSFFNTVNNNSYAPPPPSLAFLRVTPCVLLFFGFTISEVTHRCSFSAGLCMVLSLSGTFVCPSVLQQSTRTPPPSFLSLGYSCRK